ncbi:FAD-dependent monooxygenase [Salinihabitans flavidus]|nr:FAD-dependent monooxygenase [Salinihabitans flavidus]
MSLSGIKIRIIGAGVGGLAAGLALAQRGAVVSVFEQAGVISEVGAGIQVGPNGVAVLRALGLESALREGAIRARAVELRDHRAGARVLRLDLDALGPDQPYFLVHRADLIDLLASAARAAGVRVRLLQKAEGVVPGKAPRISLANGAESRADLVIGADGVRSVVREVLNGVQAPFFTRQVAWRAMVPNVIGQGPEARVHMGPGRHIVSYPLRGGETLNIVAVQERAGWAEEGWHREDDPDNLRAAFSGFGGEVPEMLAAVERVALWGLFRHPVAPVWHRGHVAILGDAAHPTLPFMAQGAVMALEDAWVLAEELDRAGQIEAGLAAYQARREGRVKRIVGAANGNAWKYHLRFGPLRAAAHAALRLGGAVAPGAMSRQFDWIYRHDVTRGG